MICHAPSGVISFIIFIQVPAFDLVPSRKRLRFLCAKGPPPSVHAKLGVEVMKHPEILQGLLLRSARIHRPGGGPWKDPRSYRIYRVQLGARDESVLANFRLHDPEKDLQKNRRAVQCLSQEDGGNDGSTEHFV